MLSLLVAGASQAQETKKMARKEHRMAKKMDRKAKDMKEDAGEDKAKLEKKMKHN
jgi:hypothetical protein